MEQIGLSEYELGLIRSVLSGHSEVAGAVLFGSRAKGIANPESDIDLALEGDIDELRAEGIASELEELPLPYKFDVHAMDSVEYQPLREHIERVGIRVFEQKRAFIQA